MSDLISQYTQTRAHTESMCEPLVTEDYVPQPAEFVSPPKWHLAHTTWFFEEFLLVPYVKEYQVFNPKFSFLFNSYYNHVGERTIRGYRGAMTRPTVDEVYKYRHHVDKHMQNLLADKTDSEIEKLLTIGINHEQQHQELLITDLKYTLSLNPLFPVYKEGFSLVSSDRSSEIKYINIQQGNYEIGHSGEGFSFDNEHNRHKVYLNEFSIASELITNGEYLKFIEDEGYTKFEFWHDEGLAWVKENGITKPLYWHEKETKWFQYTLTGLVALNLAEPLAHISFYEANAFALWRGERLPTEAEWEVASDKFSWGERWEWTQSSYTPYPGFSIVPGAIGEYNGKFMVNQMVLRGASRATYPGHSRATYRNFFHPHLSWQLTGIRLAHD